MFRTRLGFESLHPLHSCRSKPKNPGLLNLPHCPGAPLPRKVLSPINSTDFVPRVRKSNSSTKPDVSSEEFVSGACSDALAEPAAAGNSARPTLPTPLPNGAPLHARPVPSMKALSQLPRGAQRRYRSGRQRRQRDSEKAAWTDLCREKGECSRLDYVLLSPGMARFWLRGGSYVLAMADWHVASDHWPVVVSLAVDRCESDGRSRSGNVARGACHLEPIRSKDSGVLQNYSLQRPQNGGSILDEVQRHRDSSSIY